MPSRLDALTLEQKVAQLFMVGFSGIQPGPIIERFLKVGVGGVIFFRDNFDSLIPQTAASVVALLDSIRQAIPEELPRPFFSIDQEGGQVERLPHTVFPTGVTPRAIALSENSETLADQFYGMMATHLALLGFNMDFFPTLDVNFQPANPIIGVRSFGDQGAVVWPLAKKALEQFHRNGVIAVGKHFPGHGNGTVDSHYDLPVLNFTEEELQPFQQAIQHGLSAMLVSHGFYPALQTTLDEQNLPASASPMILQELLRKRCKFEGIIITDDLCMGAITKQHGPVEAALLCLKAGADILLYKQSTEEEWMVYQAVLKAFQSGQLSLHRLDESVERLLKLKALLPTETPTKEAIETAFDVEKIQTHAEAIAGASISILHGNQADHLPLDKIQSILLVHPERSNLGNYAFDVPTSPDLPEWFQQAGFSHMQIYTYIFNDALREFSLSAFENPDVVIFISFNPLIQTSQIKLFNLIKVQFPKSRFVVASAGAPYDLQVLEDVDVHLGLCSYRPATMKMLPRWLLNPHLF